MARVITDDLLKADSNNFTLARLILATAVIYTHAMMAAGSIDETTLLFGQPISWLAVNGFFSLSGFLMYRSLERNPSVRHFVVSRFMRIWPGMFVMCLIVAAIFALFTVLPLLSYVTARETFGFVFLNQLLLPHYSPAGIYCHEVGGGPCVVNGPLWTIRWEVSCYLAIALVSAAGLLVRRRFTLIVLPALVLFSLAFNFPPVHRWLEETPAAHAYYLEQVARLWTAFAIGSAAYANRDRIKLSWLGAALALVAVYCTQSFFFADLVRALAVCYWVLCIGFLTVPMLPSAHKLPDYSFGVYIYGMPVMNIFRILVPDMEPHLLAVASFFGVIPFAAFSWHVVEKPAQDLRKRFGRKGKPGGGFAEPARHASVLDVQ